MLSDYVIEHGLDIMAITETWLFDEEFDVFFCRDICPAGFEFYHEPWRTSHGICIAILARRQFKVVKQHLAGFRTVLEFMRVF